jgi:hypothetical protein
MAEPTTFVFRCGVARFDASGHLFVHLTHSAEAPAPAQVAGLSVQAPGDQRRGQVAGGGAMTASGTFPGVPDLPRGYLLDLRGFDRAVYADGALTVTYADVAACPDWLQPGAAHTFDHDAERLRLWVKSSLPDGVSIGEASAEGQASVRTQGNRAPTLAPAEDVPLEPPPPSAPPKAEPYRPPRRPAGAFEPGKKASGLGCSTLAALAAAVAILAAIS